MTDQAGVPHPAAGRRAQRALLAGGADGELRFLRCGACGYWIHPPAPICPQCHSKKLAPEAVSGRASLHTYTVNHQPWIPGFDPPYVIAIVELAEQEGLRLTTNVVGVAPRRRGDRHAAPRHLRGARGRVAAPLRARLTCCPPCSPRPRPRAPRTPT